MKFYSSYNPDAPQLTNTWGDFNKIINYIVDGLPAQNIISVEMNEPFKVIVTLDSPAKCSKNETFKIENCSNLNYNRDYIVSSYSGNQVFLYNLALTEILPASTNGTLKLVTPGWTRKFGGISDSRTVIKNAYGMEYRFDDRDFGPLVTPQVTTDSWMKVCRVSMSSNYTSLDSTDSPIFPYESARPEQTFSASGKYLPNCLIIYNKNPSTRANYVTDSITSNSSAAYNTRGPMNWSIYANENFIYFCLKQNYSNVRIYHFIGNIENDSFMQTWYLNNTYDVVDNANSFLTHAVVADVFYIQTLCNNFYTNYSNTSYAFSYNALNESFITLQSQKSLFQFQDKVSSSLTSSNININGIQLFSPVALFYQSQVYAILPDLLYCFNAYRPTEENIVKIGDGFYSPIYIQNKLSGSPTDDNGISNGFGYIKLDIPGE